MEIRSFRSVAAAASVSVVVLLLVTKSNLPIVHIKPPPSKNMPIEKPVLNLVSSNSNRSVPTTEPVSPESTLMNNRYVLSESYWEEMTMGTWNFVGLVRIANS